MFMMMIWRMWGNNGLGGGEGAQNIEIQDQLSSLRTQIDTNQNANLIRDAVAGNGAAINQLASNLNCDFNSLKDSICCISSSLQQIGGQVGYSAERVINAVNMGDCSVITAIKDCCCGTQKEIIKMSYENQLANCQ